MSIYSFEFLIKSFSALLSSVLIENAWGFYLGLHYNSISNYPLRSVCRPSSKIFRLGQLNQTIYQMSEPAKNIESC